MLFLNHRHHHRRRQRLGYPFAHQHRRQQLLRTQLLKSLDVNLCRVKLYFLKWA
jgi:hypothetical protein